MKNARPQTSEASALDKRNSIANDLFPDTLPPVVAALWPSPGTRAADALQAFLAGPQNQADYAAGWRLAAYVKELEYDGWRFIKRDIFRPGCRCAITEYALDRGDPGTAAALKARKQSGFITPKAAAWLSILATPAAALVAMLLRAVGWT